MIGIWVKKALKRSILGRFICVTHGIRFLHICFTLQKILDIPRVNKYCREITINLLFSRRQHYFVPTLQIIWCNIVTFRGWDNWPLSMILDEIQPESCIRSHWIFILIFQPALQKMWQLICQEEVHFFFYYITKGRCINKHREWSLILISDVINATLCHETWKLVTFILNWSRNDKLLISELSFHHWILTLYTTKL